MRYFRVKNEFGEQYRSVPDDADLADYGILPSQAQEIDRMPKRFERWAGPATTWQENPEAKADYEENAKLRSMSPRERQELAVTTAMERMKGQGGPGGPS